MDKSTGKMLNYCQLIQYPTLCDQWTLSSANEFGCLAQGVGIRFKGEEKTNVEEYCISEGWVRLALGNKVDRKGNPLTILQKGPVEAWIKSAETN